MTLVSTNDAQEYRRAWTFRIAPCVVALVTIVGFLPALRAGFVTWDDDSNFLDNPYYRGLGWRQLRWMWTTFHLGHYVPLSWMTLGADYAVWGMNPAGYHFTNLALHVANAALLYFVAHRLFAQTHEIGRDDRILAAASAVAALVWAVHPLRVESVAWITERRDVLSMFWYLTSMLCYLCFRDREAARWFWASLAAFVCALLSKATAVTLPAVLLILNVYPLRRLAGSAGLWTESARRVYLELLPFAALSLATGVLSIVALHPLGQLSLGGKLAVSAYGVCFYLLKTLVPVHLSPLYRMPAEVHPLAPLFIASAVLVVAISWASWAARKTWPGIASVWLAFLVMIVPMLGVVQNGPQIAADRYTYHPGAALALFGGAALLRVDRSRIAIPASAMGLLVAALCALTWTLTRTWHDSESLWSRVLRFDDGASIAHTALANVLLKEGRLDEAIEHYRRSIAIDPRSIEVDNNWGVALSRQGKIDEAIEHYHRALEITPAHYEAHNNLGAALAQQGDLAGAIEEYRRALAIRPDFANARVNWGNALVRLGRPGEAIAHYRQALEIQPANADAEQNWGVALAQQGRLVEAIDHFQRALAISPDDAEATEYLERARSILAHAASGSR